MIDDEDDSDVCIDVDHDDSSIDYVEVWGEDSNWAKESNKRQRIEKSFE